MSTAPWKGNCFKTLQGTMQHQLRQTLLHDSPKWLPVIRLHWLRLKKKENLERWFWKAFLLLLFLYGKHMFFLSIAFTFCESACTDLIWLFMKNMKCSLVVAFIHSLFSSRAMNCLSSKHCFWSWKYQGKRVCGWALWYSLNLQNTFVPHV